MKTIRRTLAALALLSVVLATPACAQCMCPTARDVLPVVRDGWIRLVPGGMPMQAGFGRIENAVQGAGDDRRLRRVRLMRSVELHETQLVDGVSRMRAVPELRIAAGRRAVLKPGGLHLMLMEPHAPLKAGQQGRDRIRAAGWAGGARRVRGAQARRISRASPCSRTHRGNGIGRPLCAIDPHHHHVAVGVERRAVVDAMRWPTVTLVLPTRSANSSIATSAG